MKRILTFGLLLALAACVETTELDVKPTTISQSQLDLVKSQVVYNFKDPDSAKFRSVITYRLANGDTVTCGQVNGKNSFGAYIGFKQFYIRSSGNAVKRSYVDDGNSLGFASVACRDAAQGQLAIPTAELVTQK